MYVVNNVVHRANLDQHAVFDWDDMKAVGYLALYEAALDYDPTRSPDFKSYAYKKVRWGLMTAYRNQFPYAHDRYDSAVDPYITHADIDQIIDTPAEEKFADQPGEYLGDMFEYLTERESYILRQHFWLDRTGTAIAKDLHVDQTGVNRSMKTALKKLREKMVGWN